MIANCVTPPECLHLVKQDLSIEELFKDMASVNSYNFKIYILLIILIWLAISTDIIIIIGINIAVPTRRDIEAGTEGVTIPICRELTCAVKTITSLDNGKLWLFSMLEWGIILMKLFLAVLT